MNLNYKMALAIVRQAIKQILLSRRKGNNMINDIKSTLEGFLKNIVNQKVQIELKYIQDENYELEVYDYPNINGQTPFSRTSSDTCFLYANGFSHLLTNKQELTIEDLADIEKIIPKGYNTLYVLNREFLCDYNGISRQWGTARISNAIENKAWENEIGRYVVFSKNPIEVKAKDVQFISHVVYQNKGSNTSYADITWNSLEEALQFAKSEGVTRPEGIYIIAKITDIHNWHK